MNARKEKKILSQWEDSIEIDKLVENLLKMKEKGYTKASLIHKFLDHWNDDGEVHLFVS